LKLCSADPEAAACLFPVNASQVSRRRELLRTLPDAYQAAADGDCGSLHQLLAPFTPLASFRSSMQRRLDSWSDQRGELQTIHAIPGRCRFDEIAIVVVLKFKQSPLMIEYSFGEQEVGSIRMLSDLPSRVVYPESGASFVAYDPASQKSWRARYETGKAGPTALLLTDEKGGSVSAVRERVQWDKN
jgi:hypothetical protein